MKGRWALYLVIALLIFTLTFQMASPSKKKIAEQVKASWNTLARAYAERYGIPIERALAHVAQESRGYQYAMRNDQKGESYYGTSAEQAWIKLSEWEREGYDIQRVSIGLMQVVPKYGLADFNAFYGRAYTMEQLVTSADIQLQVGLGYLARLRLNFRGDLDKATMAYNVGPDLEPKAAAEDYLTRIRDFETIFKTLT